MMPLQTILHLIYNVVATLSAVSLLLMRLWKSITHRYTAIEHRIGILESKDINKTDQLTTLRDDLHEIKDTLHIIRNALIHKGLKND